MRDVSCCGVKACASRDGRCIEGADRSTDGLCDAVPGRAVNRWTRGLSEADGTERLPGVKDRTWESELPPGRLNVRASGLVTLSVVPLGLPTSDGCGKDPALLSVLGEYRNVLGDEFPQVEFRIGDPENELGRSEPPLGEKLRGPGLSAPPLRIGLDPWLNEGLGALNEGRDGAAWNDLDGTEKLGLGADLDGLLDGLLTEGPRQLGLEPTDRLDPMDGPESLENDRCCMLDDRSRASAGLPNVGIVWGPNRLLAIGEISTAAVIIITAARHLFLLSVNILLLLHCAPADHRAQLADTDQQPPST